MKKGKYAKEQIGTALPQVDARASIPKVTRETLWISGATASVWQKRYRQMAIGEIRQLRKLADETQELKPLVADLTVDTVMLLEVLAKSSEATKRPAVATGFNQSLCDWRKPSVGA
jgi:hypothetical protein